MKKRFVFLVIVWGWVASVAVHADTIGLNVELPLNTHAQDEVLLELWSKAGRQCKPRGVVLEKINIAPQKEYVTDVMSMAFRCDDTESAQLTKRAQATHWPITEPAALVANELFGWDMTYRKAFDDAHVSQNETMRKYFRDSWLQAPYTQDIVLSPEMFAQVPTEQVDAAVLVDYQAFFYFGIRATEFSFSGPQISKTRDWSQKGHSVHERAAERVVVRNLAKSLMNYVPMPAPKSQPYGGNAVRDAFVSASYVGVVSVYLDGKTRQFPVSIPDWMEKGVDGKGVDGPLALAMKAAALPDGGAELMRRRRAEADALPLFEAARSNDVGAIRGLVASGLDPNITIEGKTPLSIAAGAGHEKAVAALLELSLRDPEAFEKSKRIALQQAVGSGQLVVVRQLLVAKADPGAVYLSSVVDVIPASQQRPIAEALVGAGLTINIIDSGSVAPIMVKAVESSRTSIELFEYLLEQGAEVNVEYEGKTPLMEVAYRIGMAETVDPKRLISELIQHGADINYITDDCTTAYSWAQYFNNEKVKRLLFEAGADTELTNRCKQGGVLVVNHRAVAALAAPDRRVSEIGPQFMDGLVAADDGFVLIQFHRPFTANSDGMLRQLTQVAAKSPNVRVLKIHVGNSAGANTCSKHGVNATPTLLLFKNHKEVARKVGFTRDDDIDRWVREAMQ